MNYSTKLQTFANSAKLDEIPLNKLCHLGLLGSFFFLIIFITNFFPQLKNVFFCSNYSEL